MSELKPCPFCGSIPGDDSYTLTDGGFKYGAISCGCGAIGPDVRTGYKQWPEWKDAAVAEWNERATLADQVTVPMDALEAVLNCFGEGKQISQSKVMHAVDQLRTLLHP